MMLDHQNKGFKMLQFQHPHQQTLMQHNQQQQQHQQQQQQQNNSHHQAFQHSASNTNLKATNHYANPQQHATLHQPAASQTLHFGSSGLFAGGQPPPPPPPHHLNLHHSNTIAANHHHPTHSNPLQSQHQQQYNLNSDYSSSTYHIYDQISDLIIIKQQRMERERQLKHRRKVIMLASAAILLVGTLALLLLTSLFASSSSSSSQQQQQQQQQSSIQQLSQASTSLNQNQPMMAQDQPTQFIAANGINTLQLPALGRSSIDPSMGAIPQSAGSVTWPPVAPPMGGQRSDWFDGSRFQASPVGARLGPGQHQHSHQHQQQLQKGGPIVIVGSASSEPSVVCNGRGQLIVIPAAPDADLMQQQQQQCKCDPGFWGERCEFTSDNANYLLSRCLLTNCNGNGQCNALGRCQCYAGFLGPQCEFRVAVSASGSPMQASPSGATGSSSTHQGGASGLGLAGSSNTNNQCPDNCNSNGQCTSLGRCKCFKGFAGETCLERSLCADTSCLNQGVCEPSTGVCRCKFGFKGLQCEQQDEIVWQRLFNCSGHGKFDGAQQKCSCDQGYGGFDCSEERCEFGDSSSAPLDCGPNGLYDCRQARCVCQDGFSGDQCQVQQCSAQCLRNGQCVAGQCVCQPGWYGKHCSLNGCPSQCSGRGQCVRAEPVSGTASSQPSSPSSSSSSSSASSSAAGGQLQSSSSSSGQQQPEWRCQCQAGAAGDDCSQLVERQCDDGIDNDRDGLVDCADSECCADKACQNSTLCMKSPDPLDILMRKQPPPPTSSFFQRMQFLIEKFSSQIYSNAKDFNDSIMASKYVDRASVVRGRVTYLKQGVTGVRVSVAGQVNLGITLTREGGYFDLMVNGGGAVLIEFRREPFALAQRPVRVPWNEIVLMDNVELSLDAASASNAADVAPPALEAAPVAQLAGDAPSCSAHDYRLMRPQIVAAPRWSASSSRRSARSAGAQSSRALVWRDSGMVQQSIALPGSGSQRASAGADEQVSLVYISSRANEFMSTISIQLTPPLDELRGSPRAGAPAGLSQDLKLIHLRIVIEGNLFEQLFEPQTNLSFTWAWNRRNVYRQKCFGISTASVSVGYEYYDCRRIIWTSKQVQLPAHDLSISDIGNQWNLNIHHRYNYRDSILQRGDGHNFNLKTDKPRIVQPIMGDGYQRQAICPYCDGATSPADQRLLKPQALAAAPDGSLYVGDANLVRRIEPPVAGSSARSPADQQRAVRTVLELPTGRVPSRYSLALNSLDGKLYMADPERAQVYLVRESAPLQPSFNESLASTVAASAEANAESLVPVAGSGAKCADTSANCGDGQAARAARLVEPRALAFDLAGRMYVADGANVRMVDLDGRIYTILGDYGAARHAKFPCSGEAVPMHKFQPRAPQDLATSPLDDALHVLDENVVYRVTPDKRVQIVAGRPAHCLGGAPPSGGRRPRATEVLLQAAQSIAFNQHGELFISEDDQRQQIARVLLVAPEEDSIALYAGLALEPSLVKPAELASGAGSVPTVDTMHTSEAANQATAATIQQQQPQQQQQQQQRSSNVLPGAQATRALDYKFSSIAAIALDQQGRLIVADKHQLRLLAVEPDLAQVNAAGEYELQSPDNPDELLVFNRHGHHIATRDLAAQSERHGQRAAPNKYTFTYNVNTSFGQLASVAYATGNRISIFRDGPHHSVKMIETAFGGQCKLDISRSGQVHSIAVMAPNATKTNFSYHVDGGLLKQSRDQASGESYEFSYDEFGRALAIQHASPRLAAGTLECRLAGATWRPSLACASLVLAE